MKITKRKDLKTPSWQYDFWYNGKRYRKSGFSTSPQARLAGKSKLDELEEGTNIDKNMTFSKYFDEWVDTNNKMNLSQPQVNWYKRARRIVLKHFEGDIKLSEFTKQRYQGLLNQYGKTRSKGTVRKLHGILAQMLRDANYDGYIAKDPTYKIEIQGAVPAKKEEDKYISIEQYLALIDYFKSRDETSYILLYILAITGGRFSEVNNMKYSDITKKIGYIHLPGTKTENADRYVEVNQRDIELIKKKINNRPRRMDGYLFNLSHNGVKRSMNYAKKQIGMADKTNITTYALRHTHCSYLISQGIPIEYISKRLGHSSISITLQYYAHLLDEQRKIQGEKVRGLFSGS